MRCGKQLRGLQITDAGGSVYVLLSRLCVSHIEWRPAGDMRVARGAAAARMLRLPPRLRPLRVQLFHFLPPPCAHPWSTAGAMRVFQLDCSSLGCEVLPSAYGRLLTGQHAIGYWSCNEMVWQRHFSLVEVQSYVLQLKEECRILERRKQNLPRESESAGAT
jgi:hypothetical protein